jgi:hypothetical protein
MIDQELEKKEGEVLIEEYNPNKAVRLSTDLFNIAKSISTITDVHALRLIYAIGQSIQSNEVDMSDRIPRINISISAVFDYLGIRNSGRRYDLLRIAFDTILSNPLKIVERTPRGAVHYKGISWIAGYKFSTDRDRLYILLNSLASPYLIKLTQYASIRPIDYSGLTTAYQLWLYPFLKDREKMGSFRIKIADLKMMLDSERKSTYNDPVLGTNRFLLKVLGITISEMAKQEAKLARKEKRLPRFVAWDYARDGKGKPIGTLYNINRCTDLNVYVRGIKQGRSYVELEFKFNVKGSKEVYLYWPEALPPSEQRPQGAEQQGRMGYGWVVMTEQDVALMQSTFGIETKERLVALNPYTLHMKDGVISRYKKLPGFFD